MFGAILVNGLVLFTFQSLIASSRNSNNWFLHLPWHPAILLIHLLIPEAGVLHAWPDPVNKECFTFILSDVFAFNLIIIFILLYLLASPVW